MLLLLLLGRPLLPFNIANHLQNPTDSQSTNRHAAAGALVDVWSAGTLLYTMLPLRCPFLTHLSDRACTVLCGYSGVACDTQSKVTGDCKDLPEQILHPNPSQRVAMEDVKDHPG